MSILSFFLDNWTDTRHRLCAQVVFLSSSIYFFVDFARQVPRIEMADVSYKTSKYCAALR